MFPFIRYAQYATIALMVLILIGFFVGGDLPGWLVQVGSGLAVLIGLAVLLQLYLMVRDWWADQLFVVLNFTFYTGALSLLLMGFYLAQEDDWSMAYGGPIWWLVPAVVFYFLQQISFVRLNPVSLDVKLGLGPASSVPLFSLCGIDTSVTNEVAITTSDQEFLLKGKYFAGPRWRKLLEKLERLA